MGIRNIIIMSPNGLPLFSGNYICPNGNNCDVFAKDKAVQQDPTLISGLFSVLMGIAKASGGELRQIQFEDFQYLMQSMASLIIVMSIHKDDDVEDYKHRVQLCLELFLENFRDIVEEWKGDLSLFDAFQTVLEEAQIFDHQPQYRKNCVECEVNQSCSYRMVTGFNSATSHNLSPTQVMAKYPKMNIVKRLRTLMGEYMRYMKQISRYKKFAKEFHAAKKETPQLKIVNFI